jgi:purine nucleoside phosphorylase
MGCSVFISTNAAGFIDNSMTIGDIALITEHISMINKSYDGALPFDEELFNKCGLFSTS